MVKAAEVEAMKKKLRDLFNDDEKQAEEKLCGKEPHPEGTGAEYPSRNLFRRVWNYGEPGSDGLPGPDDPMWNGWKALERQYEKVKAKATTTQL